MGYGRAHRTLQSFSVGRNGSQKWSGCGSIGNRNDKTFSCPHCGQVDHADVNAELNIALRPDRDQSIVERDKMERSTDTLKEAPA